MTGNDETTASLLSEPQEEAANWLRMFGERRKERRIEIEFPATIFWGTEASDEITEKAYTLSISNSGACFLVAKLLPVGTTIKVLMHIGTNSGVSLAEIRWSMPVGDGYRIGVSFKPMAVS